LNEDAARSSNPARNVVIGRHSKVWKVLARRADMPRHVPAAIGHRDVARFKFTPADRVWVLSYSRAQSDNTALFEQLKKVGVKEVIYVSSSSTVVSSVTTCYEYPRVKYMAELDALELPNARVLTIGMMYERQENLPAGINFATSYKELAAFIEAPHWPEEDGRRKHLLRRVRRPFRNVVEQWAYGLYGQLLRRCGSKPCLLRPLDLLLRTCGARWYGYVYLSNQLWISTTS
jgi:hypothetical protein